MGHSAGLCPCLILALAVPLLVGAMLGLRGFAPTRPTLAGLAAGLAAGGLAAFVYAFSCNETPCRSWRVVHPAGGAGRGGRRGVGPLRAALVKSAHGARPALPDPTPAFYIRA